MAINVKKLKRVIQKGEPLKVLNSGVKKPAFRQNGYGLTFESANSDYLDLSETKTVANIGDYFEIDFEVSQLGDLKFLFSDGANGNYSAILDSNTLYLKCNGFTGSIFSLVVTNLKNTIRIEKVTTGIDVTLNGITFNASTATSMDFSWIAKRGSTTNMTIYNLQINNEQFNLPESRGTTTTGSNGTTATINTSHASGIQYLDSKVWNKKSFALAFDNVNSEYLELNKDINVGEELIFSFSSTEGLTMTNNEYIFGAQTTNLRAFINHTTGGVISIGCTLDSLKIDGVSVIVNTDLRLHRGKLIEVIFSPTINDVITKVGVSSGNTLSINATFYGFNINTEQFNFTEGLGNEVFGSNGTIGTINTSHASGVDRINYGMWQKNGNVLKFDSANNDYLEFDTELYLGLGDFFEFTLFLDSLDSNTIFASNNNIEDYIGVLADGRLYVQQNNIFQTATTTTINTGLNTIKYRRALTGENYISANGGIEQELTALDNSPFAIKFFARRTASYSSFRLHKVNLNNEQFQFREGQGITTTGSEGTTATINTSHASGTNYINNQVWNVSSDKWIDYK